MGKDAIDTLRNRWSLIGRFLWVEASGWVRDDFNGWSRRVEGELSPGERAAAYEEWADFWEWRLACQPPDDRCARHLAATWTDSMTYSLRRSAALAKGMDPGAWVSQPERRPDLHAEGEAIVADIIADLGMTAAGSTIEGGGHS